MRRPIASVGRLSVTGGYSNALLLVLLTGLGLRLAAIYFAQGYHHFMVNDEVSALGQVLALLGGDKQAFYLAQPSLNEGKLPGPLWTLFGVLLFMLDGEAAQGTLYAMAIINSMTVFFIYLLARRFFYLGAGSGLYSNLRIGSLDRVLLLRVVQSGTDGSPRGTVVSRFVAHPQPGALPAGFLGVFTLRGDFPVSYDRGFCLSSDFAGIAIVGKTVELALAAWWRDGGRVALSALSDWRYAQRLAKSACHVQRWRSAGIFGQCVKNYYGPGDDTLQRAGGLDRRLADAVQSLWQWMVRPFCRTGCIGRLDTVAQFCIFVSSCAAGGGDAPAASVATLGRDAG